MWDSIVGVLPAGAILTCTILSAAVPMLVYTVNKRLHERGDPPWKKQDARIQAQAEPNVGGAGTNGKQTFSNGSEDPRQDAESRQ